MVENASQILQNVTDDHWEAFGEVLGSRKNPRPLVYVRVVFDGDSIWTAVVELRSTIIQLRDVLLGPFEF